MERTHRALALRLAVVAGLGLCLSLPLAAQDTTHATRDAATRGMATAHAGDKRFLDKTTRENEKEVAFATVAQQKASAQQVRDFATRLLRDHQDMLVKLDETAVALGVTTSRRYTAMTGWGSGMREGAAGEAPTAAGGTSTGGTVTGTGTGTAGYEGGAMATQAVPAAASNDPEVRKLEALSGDKFDRAFADAMVADHKKSIAEFERASKDTTLSQQTRTLAADALPTLREHLAKAESLRSSIKTSAK